MLSLTRKTEYALIALAHLASADDELASAREIAGLYHMPLPVLTNILKTLTRAGLVESARGAKGGYRLALSPADISLASLIHTIEGPVRLVRCGDDAIMGSSGECKLKDWCPVRSPALRVGQKLQQFLEEMTLAEIANANPRNALTAAKEQGVTES